MKTERKTVRCAIYTRKSVAEGLEQEFNSLDAQREAAEAFIASQRAEGWICLPQPYDDGGFSGGNTERPALAALMDDVEAGEIDCIVVYKVDRLSRSLMDFAQIMAKLEKHNVSFVSVTQQFNTSHSMGRLTLNILLSFAQFEREIIAERTRDKVHAARRKGKWTGGPQFLGYDVSYPNRKLVINEVEANQVRRIFHLYLEKESITEVIRIADTEGIKTKTYTTRKGTLKEGRPLTRSSAYSILKNVQYTGRTSLKGEIFEGEHEAIIDKLTWDRVQKLLSHNGRNGLKHENKNKYGAFLRGLLYAAPEGIPMYHTFSMKNKTKYRYYVHREVLKRGETESITRSVNAADIENFVVQRIKSIGQDPALIGETILKAREQQAATINKLESEAAALELSISRSEQTLSKLAIDPPAEVLERMAKLSDYIAQDQTHLREIRADIQRRKEDTLDEKALVNALQDFDEIWNSLNSKERIRMAQLLIERVDYNGVDSTVAISFNATGIKSLTQKTS